jgi:hypothetical protein
VSSLRLVIFFGLLAALAGGGCTQGLFTIAYLIKGTNVDAECNLLRDKHVVVVCRPVVALKYANARVDQELAEAVANLLKSNVPKIKMVDHRKVAEWMDEHDWSDYTDVGKAMGAELVVGIDLEQFELLQGHTLFQGRAVAEITVFDCKTGEAVFNKAPPPTVYPPNHVIPIADKQESQFRREFIHVVADKIGRHFYEHDPNDDNCLDTRAMD